MKSKRIDGMEGILLYAICLEKVKNYGVCNTDGTSLSDEEYIDIIDHNFTEKDFDSMSEAMNKELDKIWNRITEEA